MLLSVTLNRVNFNKLVSISNFYTCNKVKIPNFAGENDIRAGFPSFSHPARVTLSCPEKGEVAGKLVLLPNSLQELLDIGAKKFGLSPTKILTKEGAEIEDIELIRDGDHLVLFSNAGTEN